VGPLIFFVLFVALLLARCYTGVSLRKDRAMTDQEKIDLLGEALNNLRQSANNYIVDGSWIDELTHDIELARAVLKQVSTTERIER
jgi:hypothetical protein